MAQRTFGPTILALLAAGPAFAAAAGSGTLAGSLPDGLYTLTASASAIKDLAGNALTADYSTRFHRLFGDSDGDRDVDAVDLAVFKQAYGRPANYVWWLDYDGGGQVGTDEPAHSFGRVPGSGGSQAGI